MKQTIRTKNNYTATIQIPYQKLARKTNAINLSDLQPEPETCPRTLLITHCNGTCHPPTDSGVSMKMLEELEHAFQSDMRDKDQQIGGMAREIDRLRLQLTQNIAQKQKHKSNYQTSQTQLSQQQQNTLQYLKQIKHQDAQLLSLQMYLKQKDLIIFDWQQKQQKLLVKIVELEDKAKYYAERILVLEGNVGSLGNLVKSKDREIQGKRGVEKENQGLRRNCVEYVARIEGLDKRIAGLEQADRRSKLTIAEKDDKINRLIETIGQKQAIIKDKTFDNEQKQKKIQSLFQKIYQNQDTITLLSQKLSRTTQMSTNYTQLDLDYKYLMQKARDSEIYITTLLDQIMVNKNKIAELETSLYMKEDEIKKKDIPKLYEVKIQKVIDRQEYITGIEGQLESQRRNGLRLGDRIKQLEGLLSDKDRSCSEYQLKVSQLQTQILKLRKYIEEKQKSFAWVVQRQITKDMQLNKGQQNRTYKVYPEQPKLKPNQIYSQKYDQTQQFRQGNLILQPRIDSMNILTQLEQENSQLRRIIEAQQDSR